MKFKEWYERGGWAGTGHKRTALAAWDLKGKENAQLKTKLAATEKVLGIAEDFVDRYADITRSGREAKLKIKQIRLDQDQATETSKSLPDIARGEGKIEQIREELE